MPRSSVLVAIIWSESMSRQPSQKSRIADAYPSHPLSVFPSFSWKIHVQVSCFCPIQKRAPKYPYKYHQIFSPHHLLHSSIPQLSFSLALAIWFLVSLNPPELDICCYWFLKMSPMKLYAAEFAGFMLFALLQLGYGQGLAPSPAPQGPTSDGAFICIWFKDSNSKFDSFFFLILIFGLILLLLQAKVLIKESLTSFF